MRRTSLAFWLLGGLGLALGACGEGGSGMGSSSLGYDDGLGEEPYSNYEEAPGSDNEAPSSVTEGSGCGMDARLSLSFAALNLSLPLCEFSESCSDRVTGPNYPDEPGQPGIPSDGTLGTRDLMGAFGDIPPFCLEMAMNQSQSVGDLGVDRCDLTEAIGRVAHQYPACEQHMLLPQGVCATSLERCVRDILTSGCEAYQSEQLPASCAGLEGLDIDLGTYPDPDDSPYE